MVANSLRSARSVAVQGVTAVAACVGLLAYTLSSTPSLQTTVNQALLLGALAISFQVVYGLLGELSLGIPAFSGAGAYAYAMMVIHGWSIPMALIGAAAIGLLLGGLVAAATARLGGIYFAVATFAMAGLGSAIVSGSERLGQTSGLVGVTGFPNLGGLTRIESQLIYALITFVLFAAFLTFLKRSLLGQSLATARTDPKLAQAFGLNTAILRILATAISGILAAVTGAIIAQQAQYVGADMFGLFYIVTPLAIVIIGGLNHSLAAIPGALIVVIAPELLDLSAVMNQILSAAVLLFIVLVQPQGVLGWLSSLLRRWTLNSRPAVPADGVVSAAPLAQLRGTQVSRSENVLDIRNVTVKFGEFTAVDHVALTVGAGEILGLIGANGAGKSTLVNAVSGLVVSRSGDVKVGGRDVTNFAAHRRARSGISRTFQESLVADSLTVRQNLRVAEARGRLVHMTLHESEAPILVAQACGLVERLDDRVDELSFMERRLLSIGMAFIVQPLIIILDEATAGLSSSERDAVSSLVRALATEHGTAFLIIEHDVGWVAGLADRLAALDRGQITKIGSPQEVLADAEVVRSYLGETYESESS